MRFQATTQDEFIRCNCFPAKGIGSKKQNEVWNFFVIRPAHWIVNPTFFTLAYQVNALPITLAYFVTGRAIFETEAELSFERNLSDFNLSLPPGVYVIQVNSGTLRTSKKIVVE